MAGSYPRRRFVPPGSPKEHCRAPGRGGCRGGRPAQPAASCYRCRLMSDSRISEIQDILSEVDNLLRERLAAAGLVVGHVLLAIAPDGAGVVRGNVGAAEMGDMAELLAEIADNAAVQRSDNEPLN